MNKPFSFDFWFGDALFGRNPVVIDVQVAGILAKILEHEIFTPIESQAGRQDHQEQQPLNHTWAESAWALFPSSSFCFSTVTGGEPNKTLYGRRISGSICTPSCFFLSGKNSGPTKFFGARRRHERIARRDLHGVEHNPGTDRTWTNVTLSIQQPGKKYSKLYDGLKKSTRWNYWWPLASKCKPLSLRLRHSRNNASAQTLEKPLHYPHFHPLVDQFSDMRKGIYVSL